VLIERLHEIVIELLLAAQALTGYAPPATLPQVVMAPHAAIERMACEGPCPVYGWYPTGPTVYLDDRLDPVADVNARSILLHELVHYLQKQNGAFADASADLAWQLREREASLAQARWLRRQGADASIALPQRARWRVVTRPVAANPADRP
jgi:hypothetical protein